MRTGGRCSTVREWMDNTAMAVYRSEYEMGGLGSVTTKGRPEIMDEAEGCKSAASWCRCATATLAPCTKLWTICGTQLWGAVS